MTVATELSHMSSTKVVYSVTVLYVTMTFVMSPAGILCHTCRLMIGSDGLYSIPTKT